MRLGGLTAVATVGAALVALTGCNGEGSGVSGPSTADFCDSYDDLFEKVLGADPNDSAATIRAFRDWADDLADLDPPADMPDDARHGLELFVEQAQGIDENASPDDLERLGEGLSASDRAAGEAFNDWTSDRCPVDLPTPAS